MWKMNWERLTDDEEVECQRLVKGYSKEAQARPMGTFEGVNIIKRVCTLRKTIVAFVLIIDTIQLRKDLLMLILRL